MAGIDARLLMRTGMPTTEATNTVVGTGLLGSTRAQWNISSVSAHRLMHFPPVSTAESLVPRHPFPTVDVPDHAHYTIGIVILVVGITGMLGNFLVIYAFCRSRSLRTPANMFIINLAVTDLLMCVTQTPIFFTTSMHKRWIFGEKGCELYAFCGALFGICSMITLMAIAVDRYVVITRPLASLGVMSRRRALCILAGAWAYSMGWSLPPFFGWSAYVPEGLLTSCSWDYMTFTPSVRSYTMLLFTFVFFIPLFIIIFCYSCIFRAIRHTTRAVCKINGVGARDSIKRMHKMKGEWKMAKIALIVIMLYVISWAPYSCVALTAFAGYADMLTPYMNSVPAVIAKASAIHNPIIYAITHPKYRAAIGRYVPYLAFLLCVPPRDRFTSSSFQSTRRSTVTSQSSDRPNKARLSSQSDSESGGFSDTEADPSMRLPVSHQYSSDSKQVRHSSQSSKVRIRDSGVFERAAVHSPTDPSICHLSLISTQTDLEDISMSDFSVKSVTLPANEDKTKGGSGLQVECSASTPVVITSNSSAPLLLDQSCFRGDQGPTLKALDTIVPVARVPQQMPGHDKVLPCASP